MRRSGLVALVTFLLAAGALVYTFTAGGHTPQLGLDLQGGTSVVLQPKEGQSATSEQLDRAISIIRRRVDGLGVAEPEITRQGNFIVVSLPGVKDSQRAIDLVGRTAKLQFRPTCSPQTLPTNLPDDTYTQALDPAISGLCVKPLDNGTGTSTTTTSTTASTDTTTTTAPETTTTAAAAATGDSATTVPGETTTTAPGETTTSTTQPASTLPCGTAGDKASVTPDNEPIIATVDANKDGTVDGCEILGPVALGGDAVSSASAAIPQGRWLVELTLKDSGLDGFNAMSGHCFNKDETCPGGKTAIVLDGNIESNPVPQTPTFNSPQIEISGAFTHGSADDLALVLNYGALPIQLEQARVETVSATLGRDSLRAGLIAGLVGIVAVGLYMILYYRALGIVVIVGLAVWSAFNFAIITALSSSSGLALSLAGVTGIIVSVGVTTDSYIVYFERMKDEVKSGKTVRSAVDHAFKRAWRTIVAADTASFIGAALLFWLTVGAVRGFAFFLGLSVVLDLFTAYFFKRPLVAILARSRFLTEARWIGIRAGLGDSEHRVVAAPAGGGR